MSAVLDKSPTQRPRCSGSFATRTMVSSTKRARQRMRVVIPHFRRAVTIGRLDRSQAFRSREPSPTLLDGLGAGLFLVDARGRILHANAAGLAILTTADFLRPNGGRLFAADPATERLLQAVFAAAGNGDAAVGPKGIALPSIATDHEHYVPHVLPFTSGAASAAPRGLHGSRRPLRAQGCPRDTLPARGHRAPLQADPDRASRSPRPSSRSAAFPRSPRRWASPRRR